MLRRCSLGPFRGLLFSPRPGATSGTSLVALRLLTSLWTSRIHWACVFSPDDGLHPVQTISVFDQHCQHSPSSTLYSSAVEMTGGSSRQSQAAKNTCQARREFITAVRGVMQCSELSGREDKTQAFLRALSPPLISDSSMGWDYLEILKRCNKQRPWEVCLRRTNDRAVGECGSGRFLLLSDVFLFLEVTLC